MGKFDPLDSRWFGVTILGNKNNAIGSTTYSSISGKTYKFSGDECRYYFMIVPSFYSRRSIYPSYLRPHNDSWYTKMRIGKMMLRFIGSAHPSRTFIFHRVLLVITGN